MAEPLKRKHACLVETLQDEMTEDDVKKFKSFCHEKIPPAVLEKKQEARDVLKELEARGVIAPDNYQWLHDTFKLMGRPPLSEKLKKHLQGIGINNFIQLRKYMIPSRLKPGFS